MHKNKIIFLFLVSINSICFSQKYHKDYSEYKDVKYLRQEGLLDKNNLRNGNWILYYQNYNYLNTIIDSNLVKTVTFFKKGIKNGTYKLFDLQGKIKTEGFYKNGKKTKNWISYYSDGKISEIVEYKKGNRKTSKNFNNGKIISKTHYKKNQKINTDYNLNGEIYRIIIENIKQKTKKEQRFFTNGNIEETRNYKNGRKYGKWLTYYPDGEIAIIETYKNSKKNGKYYRYNKLRNIKTIQVKKYYYLLPLLFFCFAKEYTTQY